uniref:Late embryogenesis abundant protein LEA-2 subgroup domain-containing protein n=1 Tax=Oryza rufipogon TaxID=4529 RepID=A0A0E0R4G5_ORYRU
MGKDCGNHGDDDIRQACRRLLTILFGLALIVAIIALIVYLVLRPTHPRFFLQDATLRQLDLSNSSTSGVLSTALQVTVASRNPNDRVGVYYDRLDVYASYKYQQITLAASLPPVYQGHGDVDVWSPVLSGPDVPFAPYLGDALAKDVAAELPHPPGPRSTAASGGRSAAGSPATTTSSSPARPSSSPPAATATPAPMASSSRPPPTAASRSSCLVFSGSGDGEVCINVGNYCSVEVGGIEVNLAWVNQSIFCV